jgi:hypothetical protein
MGPLPPDKEQLSPTYMELSQQVCSLELSKRLKELGVKQESYVYWIMNWDSDYPEEGHWWSLAQKHELITGREQYSAFTVAELGEMLKDIDDFTSFIDSTGAECQASKDRYDGGFYFKKEATTEADARAKMLIYLLENNLITL